MARTPYYLKTLRSIPHPATIPEICAQAAELFGPKVKTSPQSVRWSLERFVMTGKAAKIHHDDGQPRYAPIERQQGTREYVLHRINELEVELIKLRATLADLD